MLGDTDLALYICIVRPDKCPMRKGKLFISKQLNYDDKRITGQACMADDWRRVAFPCTTRQYVHEQGIYKGFFLQRRKAICVWGDWHCTPLRL